MPSRLTSFAPLVEVTSAVMNGIQDAAFTQRGSGTSNSMANTIDTPSTLIKMREVAFALDGPSLTPPAFGGLIDQSIDWRDRHIFFQIDYDPSLDIRWGEADDAKQPLESNTGSWYTRTGGVVYNISSGNKVGIYVDTTNGYLWIRKATGYIRGLIRCSIQLKERS